MIGQAATGAHRARERTWSGSSRIAEPRGCERERPGVLGHVLEEARPVVRIGDLVVDRAPAIARGPGDRWTAARLAVRLDADRGGQGLAAAADEDRAAGRGGVEAVAADRGADVVGLGQDAVGGVEALPAELGQVELDPGVEASPWRWWGRSSADLGPV